MNIMEKILGEVREICRCCELPGSEGHILREGNFLPLEQDERAANCSKLMAARRRVSASRLAPRPRPCAALAPSAAMPTATTSGAASTRWSRAPRLWH
jgi:hypothetical protein